MPEDDEFDAGGLPKDGRRGTAERGETTYQAGANIQVRSIHRQAHTCSPAREALTAPPRISERRDAHFLTGSLPIRVEGG